MTCRLPGGMRSTESELWSVRGNAQPVAAAAEGIGHAGNDLAVSDVPLGCASCRM